VPVEQGRMVRSANGLRPSFSEQSSISHEFWDACPGKGVDYPLLYQSHYGREPEDWRVGIVESLWTGYATDPETRSAGASGGVTSAILIHLLETNRIDAAVLVRQGIPIAEEAKYFIARNKEEILACAQSVYIPVSTLDSLRDFVSGERYAMTCLPEQSAALRVLQQEGNMPALQVKFVLGPYTGTALEDKAIRSLLRSNKVAAEDRITSLKWRAGEWPGYLEILTESGRVIRSKKIYYNFLIPFYVSQSSLQSMDFANEFTDVSVGDAWSPKFEGLGQGFSVVAARTLEMVAIVSEMQSHGLLELEEVDVLEASAMHGHMIDFKKRGGYLRNQWRKMTGRSAPDYGLKPSPIGFSRIVTEVFISFVFTVCRTKPARWTMEKIPEKILGPLFNRLRLVWKAASKPTKRQGLKNLHMSSHTPAWRHECKK